MVWSQSVYLSCKRMNRVFKEAKLKFHAMRLSFTDQSRASRLFTRVQKHSV